MEEEPNVFVFANGRVVDLNAYPPAPILWITNALDIVSRNAPWRSWLGISDSKWFGEQFILPPFSSLFQPYLSFSEYRQQLALNGTTTVSWWEALWGYASTPSTNIVDPSTRTGLLVLVIVWFALRLIKQRLLIPTFSDLGRWIAIRSHGEDWVHANEIRITKFGEYVFRLLFHASMSAYAMYYFVWDAPWWTSGNTKAVFDDYPHQPVSVPMMRYYILQVAYNADAFLSLLELSLTIDDNGRLTWSATKRGDFVEMLAHHVATNLLVVGSALLRLHRIGSMVFFVHDVSDVTVDLSKLTNFLKWKGATVVCVLIMTGNWVVTRLYLLPFRIFRTAATEGYTVLAGGISPLYYICAQQLFNALFVALIALHFCWFLMFLKIWWSLVTKFEVHDYSEHKSGEEVEGTMVMKKPKKKP